MSPNAEVVKIEFFYFSFFCRCSKTALKNGYTLFGITDHAHCWGFNGTESSLASIKKSPSGCLNASSIKTTCTENDKFCSGSIRPLWGSLKFVSSFVYLVLGKQIRNFDSLALGLMPLWPTVFFSFFSLCYSHG